jgi:hypothetical protein
MPDHIDRAFFFLAHPIKFSMLKETHTKEGME